MNQPEHSGSVVELALYRARSQRHGLKPQGGDGVFGQEIFSDEMGGALCRFSPLVPDQLDGHFHEAFYGRLIVGVHEPSGRLKRFIQQLCMRLRERYDQHLIGGLKTDEPWLDVCVGRTMKPNDWVGFWQSIQAQLLREGAAVYLGSIEYWERHEPEPDEEADVEYWSFPTPILAIAPAWIDNPIAFLDDGEPDPNI